MELDKYKKYVPAILGVFLVMSFAYTYGVSQQLDGLQDEEQVTSLIDEAQQPIIDEFDNVVVRLEGDIDEVNSTAQSNSEAVEQVNNSVSELRQLEEENAELEEELNATRSKLDEVYEWVSDQDSLEVSSVESSGGNTLVTVANVGLEDVSSILVKAEYNSTSKSTILSELKQGEEATVAVDRPDGANDPTVALEY